MTAASNERTRRPGRARQTSSRQERLQRRAATAPRPIRILFEAELGYQQWRPGAKARTRAALASIRHHISRVAVVSADGTVRRRTHFTMSPDVQLRVARRLLPVAVALGVVGLGGTNLRTDGETLVFERLADGRVQAEALAPLATGAGTGAEKGVATDGVGPVPVGPPATAVVAGGVAPAPPPATAGRTIPAQRGALPVGKGMWIWLSDQTEGGNARSIVARAQEVGLTHLYVRTASLSQGFYAAPFLDQLLPAAHAANIRVYAWDFPYLDKIGRAHV